MIEYKNDIYQFTVFIQENILVSLGLVPAYCISQVW